MTAHVPEAFLEALNALPAHTVIGQYQGTRYTATKTMFNAGKSLKLVAEELGGRDYISLNVYRLVSGVRLYPCEMSAEKVIRFVLGFQVIPEP